MWKCPVCSGNTVIENKCASCGFDTRKDFIHMRTVSKVLAADRKQLQKIKPSVEKQNPVAKSAPGSGSIKKPSKQAQPKKNQAEAVTAQTQSMNKNETEKSKIAAEGKKAASGYLIFFGLYLAVTVLFGNYPRRMELKAANPELYPHLYYEFGFSCVMAAGFFVAILHKIKENNAAKFLMILLLVEGMAVAFIDLMADDFTISDFICWCAIVGLPFIGAVRELASEIRRKKI